LSTQETAESVKKIFFHLSKIIYN